MWWSVGVVALVGFTVAFWPTVRGQTSFDDIVADLPEAMRAMFGIDAAVSIGSAPGYLQGRVFATMLPLLLIVHGIGAGASAIGGSEGDGTLELLLASPVRRPDVLAGRAASTVVLVATPAMWVVPALLALGTPVDLLDGVSLARLAGATVAVLVLAEMHACLAFAVGAATGRRGAAVAVASAVAVGGYLLQGLLVAADAPEAVRNLVPWHWYLERNILLDGTSVHALVLPVAAGTVALAAGAWAFSRRDLR